MNNDRYVTIVDSYNYISQVSSVVHSLFPWAVVVKVDIFYIFQLLCQSMYFE